MSIHSVKPCDLNIIEDKLQANASSLVWGMMVDLLKSHKASGKGNFTEKFAFLIQPVRYVY
jgi:hypothetical protein